MVGERYWMKPSNDNGRRLAALANNTIGNAVGTVAIARWVGSVDRERLEQVLDGKTDPEDLHGLYERDAPPASTVLKPVASAGV